MCWHGTVRQLCWHGTEATDRVTGAVQQQFSTNLNSALFASLPSAHFLVGASDSVSHCFNFFISNPFRMASADDDSAQLPADPGFLTPPSCVVMRGSFRCIPCSSGPGRLVSRNELRKLEEHGQAPPSTPFTIQSRRMHGILLQNTLPIKKAQWIQRKR